MSTLAELADLLGRLDPVPRAVRTSAAVAGALLGVDCVPLDLVPDAGVAVRGSGGLWRSDALVVEVGERVSGVVLVGVRRVELHSAAGVVPLRPDRLGGFHSPRPRGLVRLVLHPEAGRPLVSPWLR